MSEPDRVSLEWRKSSESGGNGNCVEVAFDPESVYLRHSRDGDELVLRFRHQEWAAFLAGVHNGEFDLPDSAARPEGE